MEEGKQLPNGSLPPTSKPIQRTKKKWLKLVLFLLITVAITFLLLFTFTMLHSRSRSSEPKKLSRQPRHTPTEPICPCLKTPVSNQEIWDQATVVARIKVIHAQRPFFNDLTQKTVGNYVIYRINYLQIFKPTDLYSVPLPKQLITASSTINCGFPFMEEQGQYLIAAGRPTQKNVEISQCLTFWLDNNTVPTNPIKWESALKLKDYYLVKPQISLNGLDTYGNQPEKLAMIMGGTTKPKVARSTWSAVLEVHRLSLNPIAYCSGTLIKDDVVVTSAHCLQDAFMSNWYVYAGAKDEAAFTTGQKRLVVGYDVPDKFVYDNDESWDVGLVYTRPFKFGDEVNAVVLPSFEEIKMSVEKWKNCEMSGNGHSSKDDNTCDLTGTVKRYLYGKIIELEQCETGYEFLEGAVESYPAGTRCFRSFYGFGCNGDSGAGVVCQSLLAPQFRILAGIHRAGPRCCTNDGHRQYLYADKNIIQFSEQMLAWIAEKVTHFYEQKTTTSAATRMTFPTRVPSMESTTTTKPASILL